MITNRSPLKLVCTYLSVSGVQDARVSEVASGPAGVYAVDLELRELKRGVEGFGADPNHYGVYRDGDALHYFLCKTVFTERERESLTKHYVYKINQDRT